MNFHGRVAPGQIRRRRLGSWRSGSWKEDTETEGAVEVRNGSDEGRGGAGLGGGA